MNPTVISLCDRTGNMVQPWLAAGYSAVTVDLQPSELTGYSRHRHIVCDVTKLPALDCQYAAVFAFPPCTHLSVSGARWFREKGLPALIGALQIVDACRSFCEEAGAPWMLENPVSTLSTYWRKPDHYFHPWEYAGLFEADNYTKKTCLWTGGGFVMPESSLAPHLGPPDDRIHKAPPSEERANIRSATPMGFAQAVFKANAPILVSTD